MFQVALLFLWSTSKNEILLFSVHLWDIILANEKGESLFSPEKLSATSSHVFITANGDVTFSRFIQSQARCLMDLTLYPHDTQMCVLSFQSYGLSSDVMQFSNSSAQMVSTALESSLLEITGLNMEVKSQKYFGKTYSEGVVSVKLKRRMQYFLYQVLF